MAFSQDGSLLASASNDETVRLWNRTAGLELQKLEGHTGWVTAVAFSQDGSLLASASNDQTVRLWNPTAGQELQKLEHIAGITTIGFTIDNKTLLTDRGAVDIGNESSPVPDPKSSPSNTMIRNNWIRQGNHNVLWLPPEYRSGVSAFLWQYACH